MSVFDELFRKVLSNFSEWIEIYDSKSNWTIEDFPYETGVNEKRTYPHCWRCVTVNQCWFMNEESKKPKEMTYEGKILKILQEKRGLYHPNCHCEKFSIASPTVKDIKVIIPEGKINWFFRDKAGLAKAWGYENDREKFIKNLEQATKESYINGNYEICKHTRCGVNLTIYIKMPGINEKSGHFYQRITSFMLFTNGRLKNNTPIGGKW